jgi:hypothetical protein
MVLTHLPSSLLLMMAPAAPSGGIAATLFSGANRWSKWTCPHASPYVTGHRAAAPRTYASGVTNFTRTNRVGDRAADRWLRHAECGPRRTLFIGVE